MQDLLGEASVRRTTLGGARLCESVLERFDKLPVDLEGRARQVSVNPTSAA
ncbi:hypothetical protein ABN028_33975 [Actinopolymorpha sp. B17G11]|uniref:hypothetical protein n=1 Tax=unclassified Actinopolymorpha TaxID=2627063 RepID=UPI0032D8CD51